MPSITARMRKILEAVYDGAQLYNEAAPLGVQWVLLNPVNREMEGPVTREEMDYMIINGLLATDTTHPYHLAKLPQSTAALLDRD